jgi:hypothetical protein
VNLLKHQVPAFFNAYFEGRDAELAAIDSEDKLKALAKEQHDALVFAGFRNMREIAWECFLWVCSKCPFAKGEPPRRAT